jgi:hypothetical protein
MKKSMLFGLFAILTTMAAAQSPAPVDPKQLEAMLKEVQAQQTVIAENQAKIDARLTKLAEAIRVARIYSSRGGR